MTKRIIWSVVMIILIVLAVVPVYAAGTQLPAPKLVSAKYTDFETVEFSWNSVSGAEGYYVYRKEPGDKLWTRLADTKELTYTDENAADGKTYYYTVKSYDMDAGKVTHGSYDTTGLKVVSKLPAPKLAAAEYTDFETVEFSWESSVGADGYFVYRKKPGDKVWTRLADTKELTYTDANATDGGTFLYTVKSYAVTEAGKVVHGSYDAAGLKISSKLSAPKLTSLKYTDYQTVEFAWESAVGADGYFVYRKKPEEKVWTRLADTKELTYTDANATDGGTFLYTVKSYAVTEAGKVVHGSYDAAGLKIYSKLSAPKLTSLKYTDYQTVEFAWESAVGADGYFVYRKKPEEKVWTRLADTKELTYTDANATDGVTFLYTVKSYAVTEAGKVVHGSYDAAGMKIYSKLPAPKLISAECTDFQKITVQWNAVPGAQAYRVYRKLEGDKAWTLLKEVTELKYTDSNAALGTAYYYTVAPYVISEGKKVIGQYEKAGIMKVSDLLLPPLPISAEPCGFRRVKVTWQKSIGADQYYVYRMEKNGTAWTNLGSSSTTEFYDKTAIENTEYLYRIKAAATTASGRILSKYKNTLTVKAEFSAPKNASAVLTGYRIVDLKWDAVTGAQGYYVYRREAGNSTWTAIAKNITGLSFSDRTVEYGKTYEYTVCGIVTLSGKIILSNGSVVNTVKSEFPAPKLLGTVNTAMDKIQIKWNAVAGAQGYRVYRRTSADQKWEYLGNTKATNYTDTVTCGTTYIYTVAGYVAENGKTLIGGYDKTGISVKAAPAAPNVVNAAGRLNDVTVNWTAEAGVDGFYVYRKEANTAWKTLAATTDTTYCDQTAEPDVTYYYTVKAYKVVDGVKVLSAYKNTVDGRRITHVHFHQGDDAWGFSSKLEKNACVLSCMSMMLRNLGENANPKLVYAANGNDAGMEFDKALAYYGRKNVCAISTSSKYYSGYDAKWGWTYVKDPENNATKAIREALDRNPEGVMCYFVRGNDMHGIVAIGYDENNIYYSDPGRVYSKGHKVTFSNTWVKKGHNMGYKHLKLIQAID